MIGELSGLTEAQLRDVLQAVRRIAALDNVNATAELDTLVWSISEVVTGSGEGEGGDFWLERGFAEDEARFRDAWPPRVPTSSILAGLGHSMEPGFAILLSWQKAMLTDGKVSLLRRARCGLRRRPA